MNIVVIGAGKIGSAIIARLVEEGHDVTAVDSNPRAIEEITGHHYELVDFQIQTMTEGRDAMGSALVKLRSSGKVYSGNGISTDIIGASIRAYVSALNKIVYEEN